MKLPFLPVLLTSTSGVAPNGTSPELAPLDEPKMVRPFQVPKGGLPSTREREKPIRYD